MPSAAVVLVLAGFKVAIAVMGGDVIVIPKVGGTSIHGGSKNQPYSARDHANRG